MSLQIFEETHYRIRAIDFDQQCYEAKKSIYLPQYFKENNALIQLGMDVITPESMRQYQREERALIATRVKSSHSELEDILQTMEKDQLAPDANVEQLKRELASHYLSDEFLTCNSMGEILRKSLSLVVR